MNLGHIKLIAIASIPATLRSGTGVVYVVFTMIFGLQSAKLIIDQVQNFGPTKFVTWVETSLNFIFASITLRGRTRDIAEMSELGKLEDIQEWARYLVLEQPALLSAIFVLQALLVPMFVGGGAFNQLAGDLQHGAVRYQLLSTTRTSLFLGRFLGMACFTAVMIVALTITLVLFVGSQLDLYEWGDLVSWGVRGMFILMIISLPYVAFCSWISGAVSSPFGSLVLTGLVIPAQPFLALGAMNAWEPLGKLIYLMPWGVQIWLFHPDPGKVVLGALGCFAYTAAFLWIGLFFFRRRDL